MVREVKVLVPLRNGIASRGGKGRLLGPESPLFLDLSAGDTDRFTLEYSLSGILLISILFIYMV